MLLQSDGWAFIFLLLIPFPEFWLRYFTNSSCETSMPGNSLAKLIEHEKVSFVIKFGIFSKRVSKIASLTCCYSTVIYLLPFQNWKFLVSINYSDLQTKEMNPSQHFDPCLTAQYGFLMVLISQLQSFISASLSKQLPCIPKIKYVFINSSCFQRWFWNSTSGTDPHTISTQQQQADKRVSFSLDISLLGALSPPHIT